MTKLSIIVPVYNVEQYIKACIESLYRQEISEDDFEVIVVNDGTPDKSIEVVADIINQHSNIMVVEQENQGLSAARNTGLKNANGEYILFVDSDDLLINSSLKLLLELSVSSKADLIVADFKKMEDEEILRMNGSVIPPQKPIIKEKTGKELLMQDLIPDQCYVWRTIYRKQFLDQNNIRFIVGITFEDIPFTHECYLKAQKCLKTNIPLYIYRKGHASISYALSLKKGKDFCVAIANTWKLTKTEGLEPTIRRRLQDDVFASFSALFYGATHEMEKASDRREVIRYMKEVAPDMKFTNGKKQQLVNFMYQCMPNTYILIRSLYGHYIEKTIRRLRS